MKQIENESMKITDTIIENMMNSRRSGFSVYCGKAIWLHNEEK
jgi:hypothetical protein